MKLVFATVVCCLAWLFCAGQTATTWTPVTRPYGGALAVTPTNDGTLYGRDGNNAMYRSTDHGLTWTEIPNPVLDPVNNTDQNRVWVGHTGRLFKRKWTGNSWPGFYTIFSSVDAGQTWSQYCTNAPGGSVLLQTPAGTLLSAAMDQTFWPVPEWFVYRSTDGGLTWQQIQLTANMNWVTIIDRVYPAADGSVVFSDTEGVLFRSYDDGLTWQPLDGFQQHGSTPYNYIAPSGTVFFWGYSTTSAVLKRAVNNGASYSTVTLDPTVALPGEIISSMQNTAAGTLLLSTQFRLWSSDDDGVTWQPIPNSQPANFHTGLPPLANNGELFAHRNNSLYRSVDNAATWTFAATGVRASVTDQLEFVSEDTLFAAHAAGLFRTDDHGATWTMCTDNKKQLSHVWSHFAVLNKDTVFTLRDKELLRSYDRGNSFSTAATLDTAWGPRLYLSKQHRKLFVSTNNGLAVSPDLGQTWQFQPTGRVYDLKERVDGRLYAIFYVPDNPAPYWSAKLWSSADGGQSWQLLTALPDTTLHQVHTGLDGTIYAASYTRLNISTDDGATWTQHALPNGIGNSPYCLVVNSVGHLFFTDDKNVYRSLDGGVTWPAMPSTHLGSSITTDEIEGLFLDPAEQLYVSHRRRGLLVHAGATAGLATISGTVRRDADNECPTDDVQPGPIGTWVVRADGLRDFYTVASTNSAFSMPVEAGAYVVTAHAPEGGLWSLCDSAHTVLVDTAGAAAQVAFKVLSAAECPRMRVSLPLPALRRGLSMPAVIKVCNDGTDAATNVYVNLALDPVLSVTGASVPFTLVAPDTVRFTVGTVPALACRQVTANLYLDPVNTVTGQTHCLTAHVFPDSLCGQPAPQWSGAEIQATAECQDSVVQLRLRNVGNAHSAPLDYVIIEDDVVLMQGQYSYLAGEALTFYQPANGHTWRIESEQEPGHPYSTNAVAFVEGCGGLNSLGYINQFPLNNWGPTQIQVCAQSQGPNDPNDKQGFPLGHGPAHHVRPGQALDYLIRFQNVGTDTAFTVVIRDTLSPWLDPASVREGAGSHAYTWALEGQGVLIFTFSGIQLPDSNANEPASHGFVSFSIDPKPAVPLGTEIRNSAAIYFDYEPPVITNETRHTIAENYLTGPTTSLPPRFEQSSTVLISPNPATDATVVRPRDGAFAGERFTLTNAFGQVVHMATLRGKEYRLQRGAWAAGIYGYSVESCTGRLLASGTVLFR